MSSLCCRGQVSLREGVKSLLQRTGQLEGGCQVFVAEDRSARGMVSGSNGSSSSSSQGNVDDYSLSATWVSMSLSATWVSMSLSATWVSMSLSATWVSMSFILKPRKCGWL